MQDDEIMQQDAKENYTFTALLPQSACWILYKSADRRGAGSTRRVPLGRNNSQQLGGGWVWSYGLWILMTVQWSRYANQQWSFSPMSAEKSGCVQTGNLCHGSIPHMFFFCFFFPRALATLPPLTVLPLDVSPCLTFHTSSFCFNTPWHEDVYFWLPVVASCTPHLHLTHLLVFCTLPTLSLMT